MKKVFIIHGWGGNPEEGWFPWLKKELENRGFKVEVPSMPNPEYPKINEWVNFLSKLAGNANEETFFVGHSIGCQAILRYLEILPQNKKIGGVIFVASWINLMNLPTEEEKIAKPWLNTNINWDKILEHTHNFVAVFSDNDKWVPISDSEIFREKLRAKIFIEHNKGHFSGDDNVKEIKVVLNEFLSIVK